MLTEEQNKGTEENRNEAPEKDTPQKTFFDELVEKAGLVDQEEEVTTEVKADETKSEPDPKMKALEDTLTNLVKEEEAEIKKIQDLLPNTKDEAKKLELERALFDREKKLDKLRGQLTEPSVIDVSEVKSVLGELKVPEDGEAYKLVTRMSSHKSGAADLLKMYSLIAKAIKADLSKVEAPIDITSRTKESIPTQGKEDDSIVGQIARSIKN